MGQLSHPAKERLDVHPWHEKHDPQGQEHACTHININKSNTLKVYTFNEAKRLKLWDLSQMLN